MECQFCHGGLKLQKICGKLHSVVNEKCNCVAHHKCMQYSSNLQQFKFTHFGGFLIDKVEGEVKRGQKLTCSVCKRKGATAGCAWKDCKRTYHYPCAKKAIDAKVCRYVVYASQDVDPKSIAVMYCIFCNSSHQKIYTENLRLASGDELSSNSENDWEDGSAEELPENITNDDLFQQQYPRSSSPDDNVNLQCQTINRVDDSTSVVENVSLPTDVRQNSVGTSSAAVNKSAVSNINILDAAVPATPLSSLARCTGENLVDCSRQNRLCLKSSQRKRKARQMEESTQVKPLLQDNGNSCNEHARIDSSTAPLCETETKRISTSSAETVTLKIGCVGESGFNDDFLPNLDIPDPMDYQIHLNKARNLPDVCASSSRMQNKKLPNPGHSQPMITSYLTPRKEVGMAVTKNCTTQVPKMAKDKSKAQRRLQLSDVDDKRNENVIQTRLINEAEKIQDDVNPLPSSILPIAERNVSPMKSADLSPITEMTVSPITEIVSAAKVRKEEGMTVTRNSTTKVAKIAKNKSKAQKRMTVSRNCTTKVAKMAKNKSKAQKRMTVSRNCITEVAKMAKDKSKAQKCMTVSRNCTTEVAKMTKDKLKAQKQLQLSSINAKPNENVIQTRLINEAEKIQDDLNRLPSSILPIAERNVSPITEIVSAAKETSVSSVSLGISGSPEHVGNPSKQSTGLSSNFQLPFSPRILKQNLPSTIRKLLLDGRGSFSLLTEIESLLEPLSDSSNDATESSESLDGDTGLISVSTTSCSSYEELSSTLLLHQMEEDTEIDRVFGLCIPVTEESLDDKMSRSLLKYAIYSLDLVEENIFLWQITGLNEIQIISIILQFSRYLRDKNELELLSKLFKQKAFDANSLLDNETPFGKEDVRAIKQEIEQNFSEAEKKYGRCVGKLCGFEDLKISAAFLILSDTNDNTSTARSCLPKNHRVHICSEDAKFVISHNLSDAQRMIISDNEFENLKWFLETKFDYCTVLLYPMENILLSSNAPSVTNRLKNYFMQRMVTGGDTSIVFIQRTNPDLLIYRSFICKLLAFVKEEILTCNHDACIVFDVGQDLKIEKLVDVVMPCLIGRDQGASYCFQVKAFAGTNPVFSPVSCLVIHLLLKFSENC